nr:S-adenosylmethionine:tRNA ribosyltransferase-isomerase [Paludibacteraceae bacterium]
MNDVVKDIQISQYDYDLPDIRIAKYPLSQRDSSKLLVYKQGKIDQTVFSSISTHLPPRSLLVYNNTKV